MPLQLGGVETERPQVVTWNPESDTETREAHARCTLLARQGFVRREVADGEVIFDPPPRAPHLGTFRILSDNGDDRVVWDRTDAKQVKEAFKKFKELLAKGYTAFAVLASGQKGHKITDFDPGLQEILFVPATMPG